jgi:hypothetical protein
MSGADGFSKDWTDLPGDNIGRLYIMEEPEPAWAAFERLQRRRREGRFANPIDYEAVRRLQEARMDPDVRKDLHPNVRDLIASIEQYLLDTYGPQNLRRLPDGLRLEIHPAVFRHIRRDPEHYLWPEELSQVSKIPVKVTYGIPTDTWRLVIVVEDVLLGGRL